MTFFWYHFISLVMYFLYRYFHILLIFLFYFIYLKVYSCDLKWHSFISRENVLNQSQDTPRVLTCILWKQKDELHSSESWWQIIWSLQRNETASKSEGVINSSINRNLKRLYLPLFCLSTKATNILDYHTQQLVFVLWDLHPTKLIYTILKAKNLILIITRLNWRRVK